MNFKPQRVQRKVAELLHDIGCADKPTTHAQDRPQDCPDWAEYVVQSAFFLAKLSPFISRDYFPTVREDERSRVAYRIRAELVCCDIFEKLQALIPDNYDPSDLAQMTAINAAMREAKKSSDYHEICYYGGWAASIAENECPGGSKHCLPMYFCPTAGEYESPCHGGFDTCCDRPDLHKELITDGQGEESGADPAGDLAPGRERPLHGVSGAGVPLPNPESAGLRGDVGEDLPRGDQR